MRAQGARRSRANGLDQPALVSEGTTQAGDVRSRWAWTEPSVWTDRMLEALENGVKGGRWYSLHDKAFSVRALEAAFAKVKANKGAPGVDGRVQTAAPHGRDDLGCEVVVVA